MPQAAERSRRGAKPASNGSPACWPKARSAPPSWAGKLSRTRRELAVEKARLRRSRHALAERLVAIYESGTPSTASLVLGSGSYQDLVTRTDYLREIEESDSALADRVEQVRDEVRHEAKLVAALKARAVAYDERLAAARAADRLGARRGRGRRRPPAVDQRRPRILPGRAQIQHRQLGQGDPGGSRRGSAGSQRKPKPKKKSAAGSAVPTRSPTYIVMCESGGNYGAVNPSSGAGGAYQILPSTWELYGGQGEPQNAPKAEQDRIAGEIWADSGPSAWVCG